MNENTNTGLKDKNGNEIKNGDFISLDGNMTADDSMGVLPNGWNFDETDIYEVYWDERCNGGGNWSLRIPDTPLNLSTKKPTYDECYNLKYMNHAVGLLHSGDVEIVAAPVAE